MCVVCCLIAAGIQTPPIEARVGSVGTVRLHKVMRPNSSRCNMAAVWGGAGGREGDPVGDSGATLALFVAIRFW